MNHSTSNLTLGWKVDESLDPVYWINKKAKAGNQSDADLVEIDTRLVAAHTSIIAQSGSGKSFFLGRLIEEILINSRARCLVIDPNGDFRKINSVSPASLWNNAKYDSAKHEGKLPHEKNQKEFSDRWKNVEKVILTAKNATGAYTEKIGLWWPLLSVDILFDVSDPLLRSGLYHCHSFVLSLSELIEITGLVSHKINDLIDEAERLMDSEKSDFQDLRMEILKLADISGASKQGLMTSEWQDILFDADDYYVPSEEGRLKKFNNKVDLIAKSLSTAKKYAKGDPQKLYFAKAREFQNDNIIHTSFKNVQTEKAIYSQLVVADLPSIDQNVRLLAIDWLIQTEFKRAISDWDKALDAHQDIEDMRVPTFIIIDEAHNFIPSKPTSKAIDTLREKIRTVVSEGRKYGLYLILMSQRPDKLDEQIISECENKALLKLSSHSTLKKTCELLGLEDLPQKDINKCLDFQVSRVILTGKWSSKNPTFLFSAARRTVEGGKNLEEDHWAIPPEPKPKKLKTNIQTTMGKNAKMQAIRKAGKVNVKAVSGSYDFLDPVLDVIRKSKNGATIAKLKQKTGLESRLLSNALYKLSKHGMISTTARGVYAEKTQKRNITFRKASTIKSSANETSTNPSVVLQSVLDVIRKSKNGATIAKLKQKTGLESRLLTNALYKLSKQNMISTTSRGIYVSKIKK